MVSKYLFASLVVGVFLSITGTSLAEYPDRPVKAIVPFSPGGGTDLMTRAFQKVVTENDFLGQPLVVINIDGAGGSIGARQAKDANPDGYTLLMYHNAMFVREANQMAGFGYRDFAPIASVGELCMFPSVMKDSPYKDLQSLLDKAKANPNQVTWGGNLGALNHMAILALEMAAPGASFRKVQIGGGADTYAALKGQIIDVGAFSVVEYLGFKQSGVRGLAYLGMDRHPQDPDTATAREQGYDAVYCTAHVLYAPKGTPSPVVDKLAKFVTTAMASEQMAKEFEKFGVVMTSVAGSELASYLSSEYEKTIPLAMAAKPGTKK